MLLGGHFKLKSKCEKKWKWALGCQILSKRDAKKPASEGEVNLILLNDNPADINEEVYDEKIRWKESDFKIEDDKIISLSDEGLLKVARNKKLEIPEMENITIIEKEAFKGLSLRSVEIPKNIKEIKDDAFKDNHLKSVKILGKGKEISKNAFNEELVEMYGKCEKEEFLYECEDELEIGEKIVGDALGAVAPDDVSLYTFSGTTITGLSEKGKTYYTDNHNMILPGKNPQGQAITAIGEGAFQHNRLSSLDFSRCTSLTTIGSYAFCSNFLLALDLSGYTSLTNIGHYAFRDNKLKTAKIPLSLSILSEFAFKDNLGNNYNKQVYLFTPDYTNPHNLKSSSYHLINPAEGIYDVSLYTFSGTTITGLSEKGKTYYATNHNMILPGKNPRGQAVTAIESGAFYNGRKGYGLTSVNFSYCTSLTSIGVRAFYQNQLTSLDLSKCTKLKNIGDYAFNKNKLTNLDLSR